MQTKVSAYQLSYSEVYTTPYGKLTATRSNQTLNSGLCRDYSICQNMYFVLRQLKSFITGMYLVFLKSSIFSSQSSIMLAAHYTHKSFTEALAFSQNWTNACEPFVGVGLTVVCPPSAGKYSCFPAPVPMIKLFSNHQTDNTFDNQLSAPKGLQEQGGEEEKYTPASSQKLNIHKSEIKKKLTG